MERTGETNRLGGGRGNLCGMPKSPFTAFPAAVSDQRIMERPPPRARARPSPPPASCAQSTRPRRRTYSPLVRDPDTGCAGESYARQSAPSATATSARPCAGLVNTCAPPHATTPRRVATPTPPVGLSTDTAAKALKVLLYGLDSWQHTGHRPVSSVVAI